MSDQVERVVWKLGSSSNVDDEGFREERVDLYGAQFAEQIKRGHQPIAVISGAIAMANAVLLTAEERENEQITLQMRATLGNIPFVNQYSQVLRRHGIRAGEFLVTHHELHYPPETKSFVHTIEDYIALGWMPLINENGSADDHETRKLVYGGDNDGLAGFVADKVGADRVCFLTEEEGLLDSDGELIRVVDAFNTIEAIEAAGATDENSMGTKVVAALRTASRGRPAHIAHASVACLEDGFELVRRGEVGTYFVPQKHTA